MLGVGGEGRGCTSYCPCAPPCSCLLLLPLFAPAWGGWGEQGEGAHPAALVPLITPDLLLLPGEQGEFAHPSAQNGQCNGRACRKIYPCEHSHTPFFHQGGVEASRCSKQIISAENCRKKSPPLSGADTLSPGIGGATEGRAPHTKASSTMQSVGAGDSHRRGQDTDAHHRWDGWRSDWRSDQCARRLPDGMQQWVRDRVVANRGSNQCTRQSSAHAPVRR